jgi:hypothetical protein
VIDFDFVPPTKNAPATTVAVSVVEEAPVITQTVTARRIDESVGYLTKKDDADWEWDDLRDYVIHEIESRHGAQVRDSRKESGIFKSFLGRYGVADTDGKIDATIPVKIAKTAFGPVYNGMWRSAPIAVTRFTKGSDPYFADIILSRL